MIPNKLLTQLAQMTLSPGDIGYKTGITDDKTAITSITDLVYFWAGVAVVIVIIISALLFVTSRSDPAQTKRAKDALRGAVIGLAVVILAFTITQFIIGRF